jgi:hypothetical protein
MHISYALTEEAFAAAQAHVGARLKARTGSPPAVIALLVLLWALLAVFFLTIFRSAGSGSGLFSQPAIWAVAAFVAFMAYAFTLNRASYRVLRQSLGPYPIQYDVHLRDEGISVSSPISASVYFWKGIDTVNESGKFVFLLMRNGLCVPIPKDAFASEELRMAFLEKAAAGVVG